MHRKCQLRQGLTSVKKFRNGIDCERNRFTLREREKNRSGLQRQSYL